jgi:hypothetical protein
MKTLKITAHKPVYVADADVDIREFNDIADLLSMDFVQSHVKQPGFFRYSILRSADQIRIPLLAEYHNGDKWLVIGFVEGDVSALNLPEWRHTGNSIIK